PRRVLALLSFSKSRPTSQSDSCSSVIPPITGSSLNMPSRAAQTLTQYLLVDCIATTGQLYSKIRTRSSRLPGLHRHEFVPVGGVARGHQLASHLPGRALLQAASA